MENILNALTFDRLFVIITMMPKVFLLGIFCDGYFRKDFL